MSIGVAVRKIEGEYARAIVLEARAAEGECPYCREFSFASEYPVERWYGTEILSHNPKHVDLSRLQDGANLLWNHSMDQVLGVLEEARVFSKKSYCRAHFDEEDEDALKRLSQVDRGIIKNVSCRYEVLEWTEQNSKSGKPPTVTATRWQPIEVSLVSVPADPTVGIGRAKEAVIWVPAAYHDSVKPENSRAVNMGNEDDAVTLERETAQAARDERARIRSIQAMVSYWGKKDPQKAKDLGEKLIEEGVGETEARAHFAELVLNHDAQPLSAVNTQDVTLGLSDREQKRYSVLRALRYASGMCKADEVGYELECSRAIAQRLNRPARGIYVPASDLKINHRSVLGFMEQHGDPWEQARAAFFAQQRALNVGTANQGGTLVNTELDESMFFEFLFNRPMVRQLGATLLTGLTDNVDMPTEDASSLGINWGGEEDPAAETNTLFGRIQLRPKDASAYMRATRRFMQQSSIAAEEYMRSRLQIAMALGIDKACINGTGVGNVPRGIMNTAGINAVALGTNGGNPTWDAIVRMKTLINSANADIGAMAYLASALGFGKLETTLKNAVAGADYILANGNDGFGSVGGFRAAMSNQMPDNLTKGTGTNLSAVIFGVWSQILIGQWGGLDLTANPYGDSDFLRGALKIRIFLTMDTAIGYPKAWSVISDMLTT
jgi:HK97 family phage major capsid protein